jgi:hypothetical protein
MPTPRGMKYRDATAQAILDEIAAGLDARLR